MLKLCSNIPRYVTNISQSLSLFAEQKIKLTTRYPLEKKKEKKKKKKKNQNQPLNSSYSSPVTTTIFLI